MDSSRVADLRELRPSLWEEETVRDNTFTAALLVGSFEIREQGTCDLEVNSAYGAAILMPQLARTAGWPMYLTGLTIRAYVFLLMNVCLQFFLLMLIAREENVMNIFAGQMYLCNFGHGVRGPGGTEVTAARTYTFSQWVTRQFVKDSMKVIFPEHSEDIDATVDPGEYALESFGARWACCSIFIMATLGELFLVYNMGRLLYQTPTRADPWLETAQGKQEAPDWLDRVRIKIAGMPAAWKVANIVLVLFPKALIWLVCCRAGVSFLMETSTITDLIINSVALAFVLNIDEMICVTLMTDDARTMLERCQDLILYDDKEEAKLSQEEIRERFIERQRLKNTRWWEWSRLVPMKAVGNVVLTVIFILDYYNRHCTWSEEGHLVSKPMHVPLSTWYSPLSFVLPSFFPIDAEPDTAWSMPET